MNISNKTTSLLCVLSLILLVGCKSCNKNTDDKVVIKLDEAKAEEIKLNIVTERFDRDVLEIKTPEITVKTAILAKKYGKFFDLYTARILNISTYKQEGFATYFNSFITDATIKEVYAYEQKKYADVSLYTAQLTTAFKNYKQLYPNKAVPKIYYMFSGFNYAVVTTDSVLAIGLDMFLGADCKFYQMLTYPKYKTEMMRSDLIAPDAMRSWIATEFEQKLPKDDMLHQIIQEGKTMYFMDNVFPNLADSSKIAFNTAHMQWLAANEAQVWKHFVDKKLLFNTHYKEIIKYTKEAPFSTGLPRESPGRVGNWLGWQIVRSYMKNNPNVTLQQLMQTTDANLILNKSGYKPLVIA
jgi:hypothetical protein